MTRRKLYTLFQSLPCGTVEVLYGHLRNQSPSRTHCTLSSASDERRSAKGTDKGQGRDTSLRTNLFQVAAYPFFLLHGTAKTEYESPNLFRAVSATGHYEQVPIWSNQTTVHYTFPKFSIGCRACYTYRFDCGIIQLLAFRSDPISLAVRQLDYCCCPSPPPPFPFVFPFPFFSRMPSQPAL